MLDYILQPNLYPDLYKDLCHVVRINYYPPRGDNKEGWDNIDIFGWLGYPMQLKINFLCRDSILAAPIVLDVALFLDLAKRAGMQRHPGVALVLLQEPDARAGLYPEHDLFIQLMKLKNTLRYMRAKSSSRTSAASTTTDEFSSPGCSRRSSAACSSASCRRCRRQRRQLLLLPVGDRRRRAGGLPAAAEHARCRSTPRTARWWACSPASSAASSAPLLSIPFEMTDGPDPAASCIERMLASSQDMPPEIREMLERLRSERPRRSLFDLIVVDSSSSASSSACSAACSASRSSRRRRRRREPPSRRLMMPTLTRSPVAHIRHGRDRTSTARSTRF